jgi:hypothetical protein
MTLCEFGTRLRRIGEADSCRGRSTGFGSLVINTHSFKEVKFIKNYTGPGDWRGSAVVAGAGIQGRELFRQCFAQEPKVVVVGGECPVRTNSFTPTTWLIDDRLSDGLADTFREEVMDLCQV